MLPEDYSRFEDARMKRARKLLAWNAAHPFSIRNDLPVKYPRRVASGEIILVESGGAALRVKTTGEVMIPYAPPSELYPEPIYTHEIEKSSRAA